MSPGEGPAGMCLALFKNMFRMAAHFILKSFSHFSSSMIA